MAIAGPLDELELCDRLGLEPAALLHLRRGESHTPAPGATLRQITEWAIRDLKRLHFLH